MDAQALGRFLRQSREAKELTLEDAERGLYIRRRVLESFELGDFNISDMSPVQIRGFVRNYARFLGLDEDKILQYYELARLGGGAPTTVDPGGPQPGGKYGNRQSKKRKTGEQKRNTATQPVVPVAARSITDTDPSLPAVPMTLLEQRRGGSDVFSMLLRVLVALAAVAVIVFVAVQLLDQSNMLPGQNSGPNANILADLPPTMTRTPLPTFTPANGASNSLLPTQVPAFTGSGVLVTMTTTQRTYLRIVTDGIEQFADISLPGTTIEIPAQQSILVTASNAAALEVVWNGQPQGTFGGRGQQVDITFTPGGVDITSGPSYDPTSPFTPTPLPTEAIDVQAAIAELTPSDTPGPSPTPTETPTETLTPTVTLTPSITPTPSDTPTITPTPTITLTPSNTPTETLTPTVTLTPSPTLTPSITPSPTITMTPSPTAILPPRNTPVNPTATKAGA
jgi:hypothetical protein